MKLRLRGASVRVRLDQRDLSTLMESGRVEDGIRFGEFPDQTFSYAVELQDHGPVEPRLEYTSGHFVLLLDRNVAKSWNASSQVGFETQQDFGETTVRIILEKDFACLDRPASQAEDDQFAFPNPASSCGTAPPPSTT